METKDAKTRGLIRIFGNNCWMGYAVSNSNPYTFHHIRKRKSGGAREIQNGALLTRKAHNDLNRIEKELSEYYRELNEMFRELNNLMKPPTVEYYKEINRILLKVSTHMELSNLFQPEKDIIINYPIDYNNDSPIVIARTNKSDEGSSIIMEARTEIYEEKLLRLKR